MSGLPDSLLVACLCAEWCNTCQDYKTHFAALRAQFPQAEFVWIDIEDQADVLHPLDVLDFPTLLLVRGTQACFFGPVMPNPQTLQRLVQNHLDASTPALPQDAQVQALIQRIGPLRAGPSAQLV